MTTEQVAAAINPWQVAQQQFDLAAERLNLDPGLRRVLREGGRLGILEITTPRGPLAPAARPSGDAKLAAEGKSDKVAGKVQNAVGGLKDALRGK